MYTQIDVFSIPAYIFTNPLVAQLFWQKFAQEGTFVALLLRSISRMERKYTCGKLLVSFTGKWDNVLCNGNSHVSLINLGLHKPNGRVSNFCTILWTKQLHLLREK